MWSWWWLIDLARWHFIPTKESAMAQETGRLFFMNVFKHHGLPKDIMSNRNPKFTRKFWWALWKHMGSKLKMSTSFQPQMDGQTERMNLVIQQFLKNYVAADQQNWVDHLELAKFVITIQSIRQQGPPLFKWWRASHQLCPQLKPSNPQVMQMKKCRWSHNLMKRGGTCGRWPRPILRRRINNTKTLQTSLDERWILNLSRNLGAHHLAYNKDHVNKCKIYGSKFKINQFQALGHEFRMEKMHLKWKGAYHEIFVMSCVGLNMPLLIWNPPLPPRNAHWGNASHIVCPNPCLGKTLVLTSQHITRKILTSHSISLMCFSILGKIINNVIFRHQHPCSTIVFKNWFRVQIKVSPLLVILNPDLGCFL